MTLQNQRARGRKGAVEKMFKSAHGKSNLLLSAQSETNENNRWSLTYLDKDNIFFFYYSNF